jgi:hypothetical protein
MKSSHGYGYCYDIDASVRRIERFYGIEDIISLSLQVKRGLSNRVLALQFRDPYPTLGLETSFQTP